MKKATKLYHNGIVLTMDAHNSTATALALCEDRILAVGHKEDLQRFVDETTSVHDLEGKTVLPGFYDAHGHFLMNVECRNFKVDLNSPPIGACKDFGDITKALGQQVQGVEAGNWVVGYGFDDTMIAEKRFLTRHDLDRVSTNHPIFVGHISGHLGVLNTLGLSLMGIDETTQDPEGSVIVREEDGKTPNGILEETAVVSVMAKLPKYSAESRAKAAMTLGHLYAERGTTTAIDACIFSMEDMEFLHFLYEEYDMPVRMLYNPFITIADNLDEWKRPSHAMLKQGGVKLLQDGSIQGFTAYLSKPYHTAYKNDPQWRGYPTQSREKLTDIVEALHASGKQCVIHTNGDAATDDALAAIESALKKFPRPDHRHLIIHGQTMREEQLDKAAQLGVSVSFFGMHIYYWGDRHNAIFLGPERAQRLNPLGSAAKRGIVYSNHCDAPIVPYDPLLSIHTCVNRMSSSGAVYGENQKLSVMEALRAHTINPAIQNFEDDVKGSLEPGKFADFVVLNENPLECDPLKLKDMTICQTMVGGRCLYDRNSDRKGM